MDATIWTGLVGRYFQAAAQALDPANLRGGTFRRDQAAIKAVAGREKPLPERARVLADWLVVQRPNRPPGLKPEAAKPALSKSDPAAPQEPAKPKPTISDPARDFALAAAAEALPVLDRLTDTDIPAAFAALRGPIARAYDPKDDTKRSLLHLTSKLLWCRFPEAAPIYDPAAANAVAFLVKLLKTVEIAAPYQRIAEERRYDDRDGYTLWDPNNKKMVDCWYYKDYVQSHAVLFQRCRAEIVRRIVEAGPSITTASPFQVFDKMLWLLGDHRHDYSLKGSNIA